MTLQAICRDLQLECFDVKFDHKFLIDDYVFDAVLRIKFMILFSCKVYSTL